MKHSVLFNLGWAGVCLLTNLHPHAETLVLQPAADTSLHEFFPENNFGAFHFLHGGVTGKNTRTRALLKFDLADAIPEGAPITAASLTVSVVFAAPRTPVPEEPFALHRLLTPWNEGDKDAGAGSSGQTATAGEATWRYAEKPIEWAIPGGDPGTDFSAAPGAEIIIGGAGTYTFVSSPGLVADVQHWLEHPGLNFGWMLRSSGETIEQSAKRFGSRESDSAAQLTVEYSAGNSAEVVITSIQVTGDSTLLEWTGGTAPYQVERCPSLTAPNWVAEGAPSLGTETAVPFHGTLSFFRVRSGH